MWRGYGIAGIVAVALLRVTPVAAQLTIAPPTPPPLPLVTDAMLLAIGSAGARMTVPVTIGTAGPYPFVVDTGAQRTVVARELAAILKLDPGRTVGMTSMTDVGPVRTAIIPRFALSRIVRERIEAPLLATRNLGAAGLVGIDALQDHSVRIDFDRDEMTVRPARRRVSAGPRGTSGDDIVIVARSVLGQLIVTDAWYGRHRIAVVVDTGTPVSVGNRALLAVIERPVPVGTSAMVSVTGALLAAPTYAIDRLNIGGVGFENLPVIFADVPPFARFGLATRPALLLGMDMLRLFRRVDIDFANREIRFTLPRRAR